MVRQMVMAGGLVSCALIFGCMNNAKALKEVGIFPGPVRMGVVMDQADPSKNGIGIRGVIPDGPAEKAGVKSGDRIMAIDGFVVNSHEAVGQLIQVHQPGEVIVLKVERSGKEVDFTIRLMPQRNAGLFDPRVPQVIYPGVGSGYGAVMGGRNYVIREMGNGRLFFPAQEGDHFQIIGGSGTAVPHRYVKEGKILLANGLDVGKKEVDEKGTHHHDAPLVMISSWADNQSADVVIRKGPIWFDLGRYSIRVGEAPISPVEDVKAESRINSNPSTGLEVHLTWDSIQADCVEFEIERNGEILLQKPYANKLVDLNVKTGQTYVYKITPSAFEVRGPSISVTITTKSFPDVEPPKTSFYFGWPYLREVGRLKISPSTPIVLSLYDNQSGVYKTGVSIDGKDYEPVTSPMFMSGQVEGPHVLKFKSEDKSGNWEAPIFLSLDLKDVSFSTTVSIDGFLDIQNEQYVLAKTSILRLALDYNGGGSSEIFYGIDLGEPKKIYHEPISILSENGFGEGPHHFVYGSRDSFGNVEPIHQCTLVKDQYAPYLKEVMVGDIYHARWDDSLTGKNLTILRSDVLISEGLYPISFVFSEPVQGIVELIVPNDLVENVSISSPVSSGKGMIWRSTLVIDGNKNTFKGDIKIKVSAHDYAKNELEALNVGRKNFVQAERTVDGSFFPIPITGPDVTHTIRVNNEK